MYLRAWVMLQIASRQGPPAPRETPQLGHPMFPMSGKDTDLMFVLNCIAEDLVCMSSLNHLHRLKARVAGHKLSSLKNGVTSTPMPGSLTPTLLTSYQSSPIQFLPILERLGEKLDEVKNRFETEDNEMEHVESWEFLLLVRLMMVTTRSDCYNVVGMGKNAAIWAQKTGYLVCSEMPSLSIAALPSLVLAHVTPILQILLANGESNVDQIAIGRRMLASLRHLEEEQPLARTAWQHFRCSEEKMAVKIGSISGGDRAGTVEIKY